MDYNNPTPPNNYSYNWNGSSNNNNKGNGGRILVALAIIVGVLVVGVVGVYFSQQGFGSPFNDSSSASGNADASQDVSGSLDFSRDPDISVPEFSFAPESDKPMSDLSALYAKCSPSCCTIRVGLGGQPFATGSGFVIDGENGYIATNHHVIEDGDEIKVVFYDGREYEAKLVGSDAVTDIAVLYVQAEDLKTVGFGNSNNLRVGETCVAIGTPYDETLAGTMTSGIVSGVNRAIEITNDDGKVIKTMTLIQTDCSINPGNSGGPLFDSAGNVIGITSLKIADELYEGIGFAIPITSAVKVFQKLIAGEPVGDNDIAIATPQIGITVYDVEDGLEALNMNPRCEYPEGVIVATIDVNSAAYRAGLTQYDIITDFNGEKITNRQSLADALSKYRAGETVTVTVFRFNRFLTAGSYETIEFKLDAAS